MWDIYPGFELGGFGIRWYSVIYSVTLVACWLMLIWQIKRGGGKEADANWLAAVCIFAVFVGGRLGHLFFYDFERLAADPSMLWRFRDGGIASHGSTFGLIVVLCGYALAKRLSPLEVGDRSAIAIALAAATVRIGNLFNSEVVGRVTDQTWGVRFPYYDRAVELAPLRHPSQLYEFAMGFAILVVLVAVDHRLKEARPRGLLISLFLVLYFSARFVVEFFKEYQALPTGAPLTMGQLLSVPLVLLGLVLLARSWRRKDPVGWHAAEIG